MAGVTPVIEEKCVVSGGGYNVEYDPSFFDEKYSDTIFKYLEANVKWSTKITQGRRVNQSYGDPGIIYEFSIRGKKITRTVTPWKELPFLEQLKDYVSQKTGKKYNYVVIQRYPNKNVGMKPHRDKEMVPGTTIAGISLGARRTAAIGSYRFSLGNGSIYMLHPPTNDRHTHCIENGEVDGVRISLTFRLMPSTG